MQKISNSFTSLRHLLRALCLGLLLSGLTIEAGWAQSPTPGLIFKPATAGTPGSAVLDPNNDGYVSTTASGFTTAAGDIGTQSEIPYKYLPQRTTTEPNADLRVGPSNKFTDFADVSGGGSSVGFFVDANSNFMFRFRLGGSAPNSKGYSIAIDTDNKFGFTGPNADPNAVAHNPGFEMEIVLDTNFGVRLFKIDGTTSPTGTGPDNSLVELPYASYAQKAIAVTTNGGDLDVFYDFYIPLSVIQTNFGSQTYFNSTGTTAVPFSLTTSLRMVANTLIAPHSITQYQNISDIGGINDAAYPNPDYAFTDLITGTTPTSGAAVPTTSGTAIPARSAAPVVNSPIQTGATAVSGTSTEAAGTVITVYVNGTALSTTAVVQSGGTWTLTGLSPLANGALVKATATAAGKSASDFSNVVQVMGNAVCSTPMPAAPTCVDPSGRGIQGNATNGYLIYLRYLDGTLVPTTITNNPITVTTGTYLFTSKGGNATTCSSGQPNLFNGSYLISQVAPGNSCESAGYQICVGTTTTATPVVTTAKPITSGTTSLTGTATAGATVILYINGVRYTSVTATGGNYSFSASASPATLPTLIAGQQLTITAAVNLTSCESAAVTLNVVANRAVSAPIVNSPIVSGATTVSGTSTEAAGSTINLTTYSSVDGSGTAAATYTATVQSNGTWSATVTALTGGSVKATVTTVDYGTSGFSNVVPVQTRTASTPVISSTYAERGTSISGTSAAAVGSLITVYEDGDVIGTATVQTGGTWTLTGLSNASGVSPNTLYPTLYAGGVLTATATETGKLASTASAPVTVGCVSLANKSFSTSNICQNNAALYTISNVEPGVVYTLQDATSGTNVATGVSRVGTGSGSSNLIIPTSVLTTAGTYSIKVNAFSVGAVNCNQTTTNAVPVTVNPLPASRTIAPQQSTVGPNNTNGTTINIPSSESGVSYQLINTSVTPNTNVGSAQPGNGNTLAIPTGPINSTTTYAVTAITSYPCTRSMGSVTVNYSTTATPLPVVLVGFEAVAKNSTAVLSWSTASEQQNDHFEVERSSDGQTFTYVGRIAGQGTSTHAHNYTDAGGARFGQQFYYRLRQVDVAGAFSFSSVRSVHFAEVPLQPKVLLYPNPTSTNVNLDLSQLPAATYTVRVLSLTGQLLSTVQLAAGQAHELEVASLPAGMYLVHVQSASLSLTQSLVKLH
jgi:hypothetical protein